MQLPVSWRNLSLDRKVARGIAVLTIPLVLLAIPVIYLLLKAVLGVIALGIVVVGALALWYLLPAINLWLANLGLKLLKIEARKNPIETLENRKRQRADRLTVLQGKYANIKSAVGGYKNKLALTKRERPDDDYTEEEKMVARFDSIVARIKQKMDASKAAFALFEQRVESAKSKYGLQLEAAKVKAAIGSFDGEAVLKDILEREAFDSVDTELDKIFTELEIMLDDENVLMIEGKAESVTLIERKGEAVPFLLPTTEKEKQGVRRS